MKIYFLLNKPEDYVHYNELLRTLQTSQVVYDEHEDERTKERVLYFSDNDEEEIYEILTALGIDIDDESFYDSSQDDQDNLGSYRDPEPDPLITKVDVPRSSDSELKGAIDKLTKSESIFSRDSAKSLIEQVLKGKSAKSLFRK